jgi:glyoxylase-like metal-dependent hydrolase (beta-lactamase superfamily II)
VRSPSTRATEATELALSNYPALMATMTRQEQEPARSEVTDIGGILRMQLPVELPGLGHVNCYALEDERGVAVVDPGLPGPETWAALEDRLGQAGIPMKRIHTVVVTHSHPDHFGLAGRLQQEHGAELLTHRTFRTWWAPDEQESLDDEPADADRTADADRAATPTWERPLPWAKGTFKPPASARLRTPEEFRALIGNPVPTILVDDAQVVRLGKREWVAVHTPGHTPDHLCLFDPAGGVFLSGDHVLPTITPHISGIGPTDDPLAEFFRSLDRMTTIDGVEHVLPAHGHPFHDLAGRADAIKHHHEERLDRLRGASAELDRSASVNELSQHLFSPRAWGPMAESETYAHLEHLRLAGQADRVEEAGVLLYTVH